MMTHSSPDYVAGYLEITFKYADLPSNVTIGKVARDDAGRPYLPVVTAGTPSRLYVEAEPVAA